MISTKQRPLPGNTQRLEETDTHVPRGIRTRKPSKRAAADPGLRCLLPRSHWDRLRPNTNFTFFFGRGKRQRNERSVLSSLYGTPRDVAGRRTNRVGSSCTSYSATKFSPLSVISTFVLSLRLGLALSRKSFPHTIILNNTLFLLLLLRS